MKTQKFKVGIFLVFGCTIPLSGYGESGLAEIREELVQMGKADAAARSKAIDPADPEQTAHLWQIDGKNQVRLKQIIAQIGWPTAKMVGEEASDSAFLIAQHAAFDLLFMKFVFGYIEAGYHDGEVAANRYAQMADRIAMLQDKPQYYGTQIIKSDSKCAPWKLANPTGIDAARAAMGLEKLSDYVARVCNFNQ